MVSKRVLFKVLCEDLQQQVFFRRFLLRLGFAARELHLESLPAGRGAGDQYVRSQYARLVKAHRAGTSKRCLVVCIDADKKSVEDRLRELDETLRADGRQDRGNKEQIVLLIPKRNIETWIHFLHPDTRSSVDEATVYPRLKGRESSCQPAVVELVEWLRTNRIPQPDPPPSLRRAVEEELGARLPD